MHETSPRQVPPNENGINEGQPHSATSQEQRRSRSHLFPQPLTAEKQAMIERSIDGTRLVLSMLLRTQAQPQYQRWSAENRQATVEAIVSIRNSLQYQMAKYEEALASRKVWMNEQRALAQLRTAAAATSRDPSRRPEASFRRAPDADRDGSSSDINRNLERNLER
ncbi:hypothetical protein HIM_04282 [Hirsutella minnesotensis 3608]|uniref:Uncharacterized protein n=1 Tax=Hirsutella minnesotensis 3608 TaxID=1043627 RepID=A0A0F7ZPW3_9HYPO|nr:hypothetical protein HIM_04282 [Hirsutella minnesotensis 3608]